MRLLMTLVKWSLFCDCFWFCFYLVFSFKVVPNLEEFGLLLNGTSLLAKKRSNLYIQSKWLVFSEAYNSLYRGFKGLVIFPKIFTSSNLCLKGFLQVLLLHVCTVFPDWIFAAYCWRIYFFDKHTVEESKLGCNCGIIYVPWAGRSA